MVEAFPPSPPGRRLYENLFADRERTGILTLISEGLVSTAHNVAELLRDAELLVQAGRYARGHFLVATAEEEIGKFYVLLDACRLDFNSHEGPLRQLCDAFYDHVKKHAYYEIVLAVHENFPVVWSLDTVREVFHNELVRWWPADYNWGVPIMPHDTFFTREANLYVNFGETWSAPNPTDARMWDTPGSQLGPTTISRAHGVLATLQTTVNEGLCNLEALAILNEVFHTEYCSERTPNEVLSRLYNKVADQIEKTLGIGQNKFDTSALQMWPLYHFLQTAPKIPS